MCRVLNTSEFWIFLNFGKYDKVLYVRRDAILEKFWIFQGSQYARFLYMQALQKVLNMPEYGWIIKLDDFDFDNILLHGKRNENILVYDIS